MFPPSSAVMNDSEGRLPDHHHTTGSSLFEDGTPHFIFWPLPFAVFPFLAVFPESPWVAGVDLGGTPFSSPPIFASPSCGEGTAGRRRGVEDFHCAVTGWIFRDPEIPEDMSGPLSFLLLSLCQGYSLSASSPRGFPLWPQPCAIHIQPHKDPLSTRSLFSQIPPFGGCGIGSWALVF